MTEKALTPPQEAAILERVRLRRLCTLKALAHEFGVSITTIRRVERAYELRRRRAQEHFLGCPPPDDCAT
jgi:transposase